MSQDQIIEVLTKFKVIAVVGLSQTVDKPSHNVALYLQKHGYKIIPVNPFADEVLGEKSYKSLLEIPLEIQKTIEIVDIFRPSKDVMPIVEQARKLRELHDKLFAVWMQLGIINEEAAKLARDNGLIVIMNRCMMVEHQQLTD